MTHDYAALYHAEQARSQALAQRLADCHRQLADAQLRIQHCEEQKR